MQDWNIKNVEVIKKGVSNVSKDKHTFYIDNRSSGGDSLEITAVSGVAKEITISLVSIDDYVESSKVIPNLIKIDVQDHERYVLLGARKTILNHQPILVVETNNNILLENYKEISAIFNNYEVADVDTQVFVPIMEWDQLAKQMLEKKIITFDYILKPK